MLTVEQIKDDELSRLRRELSEAVDARVADRQEWIEHMQSIGPMLRQAKEDGVLDMLIESNLWPLPKCAVTDADVQQATETARLIRQMNELEQKSR